MVTLHVLSRDNPFHDVAFRSTRFHEAIVADVVSEGWGWLENVEGHTYFNISSTNSNTVVDDSSVAGLT